MISTVCPIGCDNAPANGETVYRSTAAAIRADDFMAVLSNRGLGAAMVEYVYNLGIKKDIIHGAVLDN